MRTLRYLTWYRNQYLPRAAGSAARGYVQPECTCPEMIEQGMDCSRCGGRRDWQRLAVFTRAEYQRFARYFVA